MLEAGLYESVINKILIKEIYETKQLIDKKLIDKNEATLVLAQYAGEVIEKALSQIPSDKIETKISIINKIVSLISEQIEDTNFVNYEMIKSAEQLLAVENIDNNPNVITGKSKLKRPETSLISSSLFTGAMHEPSMQNELKIEISSSNRIDILVSFIKWSGLRLLIDELRDFTKNGGKLRVITTTYMQATDFRAIEELNKLVNTEIKISYDDKQTRLHAKAFMFYRDTGFDTAYIGSSNISNPALTSGLEWNIKITGKDQPYTIQKMNATFENYWDDTSFTSYSEENKSKLLQALKKVNDSSVSNISLFDIKPYGYQDEILEKLRVEREERGYYKNLIVAATGTGKTVVSAFDFKRFKENNKNAKLLFVAHRQEILEQSIMRFRAILQDSNFGELFYGGTTPNKLEDLFISIQTFNSKKFNEITSSDYYDYIIIDEFHHAAAKSYQTILNYYTPKIFLGLTATPERMDGEDILKYFNHRIAAEIRLPEAIDKKLLCPFHYFGVSDDVDLKKITWSRGGYNKQELSNVYTGNDIRVALIVKQLKKYVEDIEEVKGLGFCVSIEHARYMAYKFNQANIPSIALTGESSDAERNDSQSLLKSGDIKFIFTVDLYNEGIDIPEVNTILFLRPTESLTIFLQQLGRGLRLSEGKECLTVLDFIGQANNKYNFESKFALLLDNTNHSVKEEIDKGFPYLPRGCYMQLEKKAKEYILENIKESIGNKNSLIQKMAYFEKDTGRELNLTNFVNYYGLEISKIYSTGHSFSRLCVEAGVKEDFEEEMEEVVTKSLKRFAYMDSRRIIKQVIKYLPTIENYTIDNFSDIEKKVWQMLQFTIWEKKHEDCGFKDLLEGFRKIAKSKNMLHELIELLEYNYNNIDFMDVPLNTKYSCPLDVYCSYNQKQIFSALGCLESGRFQGGVRYLKNIKTYVLLVTINKSEKEYSPTTMYKDYSVGKDLFHWQSQNMSTPEKGEGERLINHKNNDISIMLFVREYRDTKYGTATPYTFLGLADLVSWSGSKPINIIWKLHNSIPSKFLKVTNQLLAG